MYMFTKACTHVNVKMLRISAMNESHSSQRSNSGEVCVHELSSVWTGIYLLVRERVKPLGHLSIMPGLWWILYTASFIITLRGNGGTSLKLKINAAFLSWLYCCKGSDTRHSSESSPIGSQNRGPQGALQFDPSLPAWVVRVRYKGASDAWPW